MGSTVVIAALVGVAWGCEPVKEPTEQLQVAWVSKVPATAGDGTWLEVVPLADLRGAIEKNARDSASVLRALGLLGRTQPARAPYKVTVFEVARSTLCRPMDGQPGSLVAGVPVCDTPEQKQGPGVRAAAYTGCGYGTDLGAGVRGLDVYRVRWADAVTQGFCVLPWERMLEEG